MIPTLIDGVDRWSSRRLADHRRPTLDAFADAVAWGNGAPIWAASAGVLAGRGRRGRDAVARALVSYGVTSVASNLLAKRLVDRRRPGFVGRRGSTKSTSSFPSSHAATGAAFSVSVTLDWPRAGLPLLGLAVAVAGSRVYARQHHLMDVLAGVVLGSAIAATLHRLTSAGHAPEADDTEGGRT